MFAFRDGIIDSESVNGGICYNKDGAYAIVLRSSDEIYSETPDKFTYKCRPNDPGMFRLTSKCHERDRSAVRVMRTQGLYSIWAPKAGVRYDGLLEVSCFGDIAANIEQ